MDCVVRTANYSSDYWSAHTIRLVENASIEQFVKQNSKVLDGKVLDFGAGKPGTCAKPQPYKGYVKGEYFPVDKDDILPLVYFDAIICTQVLQYIHDPKLQLTAFSNWLKPGGHLLLTYPTCWDEVENSDFWRFTKHGMEYFCDLVGLIPIKHERRAQIELKGFKFPLGYGLIARKPGKYSFLDADESAALLTDKLKEKEPFIFVRFGDGAIECINSLGAGRTCDHELYTPQLAKDLQESWEMLTKHNFDDKVYIGDWLSASFDSLRSGEYLKEYTKLVGYTDAAFLHYEALLFMRQSQQLVDFYLTLAHDKRRKVYLGPHKMGIVKDILRCDHHIVTPMVSDLHSNIEDIEKQLNALNFDILIYGAGMAGNIPVIRNWKKNPERTYIHIGSALDPLGLGKTRKHQLSSVQIKQALNVLF